MGCYAFSLGLEEFLVPFGLEDQDRQLILNVLFRQGATGIVVDERDVSRGGSL